MLYLIALETPKAKQLLVQGVVYGVGSDQPSGRACAVGGPEPHHAAVLSAALLIPAYLGMLLGFRMSDRLNPEMFRKVTLIVLVVAGANLVRPRPHGLDAVPVRT